MHETLADKRVEARAIYRLLTKHYPDVRCELNFETPFQLLIATVLSAQCTDRRVNQVTPALFQKFGTPSQMAGAKLSDLEQTIHSLGFFRSKSQNIKALSQRLVEVYNSEVPDQLEELVTLAGVGRKTANVVLGHAFGIPGITVDTHFGRLSRRFGWSDSEDPVKVERDVAALIKESEWTNLSQRMIWHGRRICHSRRAACGACPLAAICPSFGIGEVDKIRALGLVKRDEDFR